MEEILTPEQIEAAKKTRRRRRNILITVTFMMMMLGFLYLSIVADFFEWPRPEWWPLTFVSKDGSFGIYVGAAIVRLVFSLH